MESTFKQNLIEQLPTSSGSERKGWASIIINENIFGEIKGIIYSEPPLCLRFAWLVSDICANHPSVVAPYLPEFFDRKNEIKVKGIERSLAKWFYLSGIPSKIEGEVFEQLSQWFLDPKLNVSTKRYCLLSMIEISKEYKDLKLEIIEMILDLKDNYSPAFKSFCEKNLNTIRNT